MTELLYSGAGCASCGGGVDKLVGVKDAKGQQTDFTYDATGQLTSEIAPGDPASRRLLYVYTDAGQLKEKRRDADGDGLVGSGDQLVLGFAYTPDGKLASKTDHLGGTATTTYGYNAQGRLQSAANAAASYEFTYFDNGWPKSVTSGSRSVEYVYDAAGRRELVTVKEGTTVLQSLDTVYDATTKELKEIVSPAGTFAFAPDAWGRRGSLTYPNGVVATYAYNAQTDWLTGIGYKDDAAGPLLLDIAYPEHDKVGNRKARVEDNVATGYGYDATYQLRSATTGPSVEAFDYDAVGNRESGPTVKETTAASYDHDAGNRMLLGRQFTYEYDEFGNQAFRYLDAAHSKFWQYSWDGENRLIEARLVKAGATLRTVSFAYDPFGRRIEKRVVEGTTATTYGYFYDAEDIVLETKAVQVGAGTPVITDTQYVHGPGIDEPLAMVRNGQSYFYHADGLGSIVAITDAAKNIVQQYAYDSFGMVTPSNPDFENSYTYTGREWDKEVGLYYYRARYYDPMEGRFISKDPIGLNGGINVYAYVQNNPVNWTDPSGLAAVPVPSGAPPVPVPGGGAGTGWKWNPNPQNSRGGSWGPSVPVKGRSQPSASWDPEGHWDVDDGTGNRQRHGEDGTPMTPEEAHGKKDKESCPTEGVTAESVAAGAAAITTGYFIYRGARMIPSVAIPALWWTIPINATAM
ncbi:MAG: hypothetical protein A2091_11405 [Desulfuromonadales bacterium GWD2_61_12]|nr:MAG: hypothetical protein A2091_11405 [Desulfuromonadales bacterium GWD2_61_12]